MAFQPLSVGDILMLSQTAWKIGRAFTTGKKSAPAEFAEVEREANGLSDALKLVAETLHSDGSVLSQADADVKQAVNGILESAHKTLSDLDSFVDRYQVIKRQNTNGGFVVERSWSEVVLANYKTFKWTTEGGDITELRNMLQMHTNSISLTMQALQSRSLSRLERTVVPMAEKLSSVHDRVNGDLGDKIDDLHRVIMALANATPSLTARDRNDRNSTATISTVDESRMLESPSSRRTSSFQLSSRPRLASRSSARSAQDAPVEAGARRNSNREDSACYSASASRTPSIRRMDWDLESGSPSQPHHEKIGGFTPAIIGASPHDSAYASVEPRSRRGSHRRESATLPTLIQAAEESRDAVAGSSRDVDNVDASPRRRHTAKKSSEIPALLPPPAMLPDDAQRSQQPATPTTFFANFARTRSDTLGAQSASGQPVAASSVHEQSQSVSLGHSQGSDFELHLFRNAAILCDVRARLVEYAREKPDEADPRFNVEMVPTCQEARLCVIRKRENRDTGGTKTVTSIWTLSDDGEVRMQQKLSEVQETVPYCSYFDPEKVSLQPAESPIALRFHATRWGAMLKEEIKTNWVNYYFESENDAVAFQSAVYGRMLVGSFRTTKTTVIHEGIRGAFAFEEQFANIEMLRLWEEDGVSTPGASGGIMALMHVSSNFGDGWARWWLNNSVQQMKIKPDGAKFVKVKGIDVTVAKPARITTSTANAGDAPSKPETARATPIRTVNGVRVEFKTEEERDQFIAAAKKAQARSVPLPAL